MNGVTLLSISGTPGFSYVLSTATVSGYIPNDFLFVQGTGMFTETGYDPTFGNFQLTTTENSSGTGSSTSFEITAGANAATPEPNSLVLLGTGLVGAAGLLFMRRRNADGLI